MKILNFFKNIKQKILTLLKTNKRLFVAVVACLIIFVLLIFMSCFGSNKKSNTNSNNTTYSVTDYASALEEKLVSMLLKLDSIESVSVMVVVESTPEVKYLTETQETTSTNESSSSSTISTTVVYEKNGSISTPIVVTTLMPKVTGILIVTNKVSASTKYSIISSVSTVLNIDSSCISLLQEG